MIKYLLSASLCVALCAAMPGMAHADDWEARFTAACVDLPDPPGHEIYPAYQNQLCSCAFKSVSYSPLWGSVGKDDLQNGYDILENAALAATPLRVSASPRKFPPFRNVKFGQAVAVLSVTGAGSLTGSSTIAQCVVDADADAAEKARRAITIP